MLFSPLMFFVVLFALLGMRLILRAVPGKAKRQQFLESLGILRNAALLEPSTFLPEEVALAVLLNLVGLDRKRRHSTRLLLLCRVARDSRGDCEPVYSQYPVCRESVKDYIPPSFSEYFRE